MKKKHDLLLSLSVTSLVCREADECAGLPILWRGQQIDEVGPIEPLPEHVRQEPYSLPQGFQWITLRNNDIEKVIKFGIQQGSSFTPGQVYVAFSHPTAKSDWRFGIKTINGKLIAV